LKQVTSESEIGR